MTLFQLTISSALPLAQCLFIDFVVATWYASHPKTPLTFLSIHLSRNKHVETPGPMSCGNSYHLAAAMLK